MNSGQCWPNISFRKCTHFRMCSKNIQVMRDLIRLGKTPTQGSGIHRSKKSWALEQKKLRCVASYALAICPWYFRASADGQQPCVGSCVIYHLKLFNIKFWCHFYHPDCSYWQFFVRKKTLTRHFSFPLEIKIRTTALWAISTTNWNLPPFTPQRETLCSEGR